VTESRVEGKQE